MAMSLFRLLLLGGLLFLQQSAYAKTAKTHYLCVFDPVGRNGDVFSMAKDIALDFLNLGVKLSLYPYSTESAAKADFRAGLCDAMALTGIHVRDYNKFTYSIGAVGAISSYEDMWTVVSTLAQPRVAPLFSENGLEVAGIYPAGAVYLYLKDKNLKAPHDFVGKRIFTTYKEPTGHKIIGKLGGQAIEGDTTNFASKFKRGKVDVTFSPAAVTEALELDKGMQPDGGILDIPIWMLTLQVIVKPEKFEPGLAQKARELSLDYFEKAIDIVTTSEGKLGDYWIETDKETRLLWDDMFAQIRSELGQDGVYDPRMLKVLKKLRCRSHPERQECLAGSLVSR